MTATLRLAPVALAALNQDNERRIVVTGAGGWLGSATIDLLHEALGATFADRVACFGSQARTLTLCSGLKVEQRPLDEIAQLDRRPTWVLHFAFLTKDRVAGMAVDDYVAANAALSRHVLDTLDPIGADGVFVASSGAARVADNTDADDSMQLYGRMKQRDEADFASWADMQGHTAVIARVFNVAGPYINKHQAYALAAFIDDALAGRAITVRAPHRVVRGYVAIRELMSLVMALLGAPTAIHRFDTGGDPLELAEVARQVAAVVRAVPVERAPITVDRIDRYVGDRSRYDELCADFGIEPVSLAEQIAETAGYMASLTTPPERKPLA